MQTVLIVIHLMIVLALVGIVLIQRSEGGGLGIGGGSGFMSARGASNALTRTTAILATLFFIAYLGLSVPSLSIGLATRYLAPTAVMAWFAGILLVLLAGVAALSRRAAGSGAGRPSRT